MNLQAGGGTVEERGARVERLREAAAAVPGVRSASVSANRILTGGGSTSAGRVAIGGAEFVQARPSLWLNFTSPGWFDTVGVPIRLGRDFETGDRVGSRPVAIVNEAFVRRFFPAGQPIGQTVRLPFGPAVPWEIIGVVADAVYTGRARACARRCTCQSRRPRRPNSGRPYADHQVGAWHAQPPRTRRRAALTKADPKIAFTFGTFDQFIEATVTQERLTALLSAFFGGLALLLAAVGLYGLVAHAVRTPSNRNRTPHGARRGARSSIFVSSFRRVGLLIAAGLALGLAGSLWAARFVEALLFQLEPRDPTTFAGAAAVLAAVGASPRRCPARRAARIDPVVALRTD